MFKIYSSIGVRTITKCKRPECFCFKTIYLNPKDPLSLKRYLVCQFNQENKSSLKNTIKYKDK